MRPPPSVWTLLPPSIGSEGDTGVAGIAPASGIIPTTSSRGGPAKALQPVIITANTANMKCFIANPP